MNLIKLDDLNALPLEEIRRKLDKKHDKITAEDKISEIGKELNLSEIDTNLVNNVVPKPEEFGEPSARNTHFIRPRYILVGHTTNFSFRFIPTKTTTYEEIDLTPISQIGYTLNIDTAWNREEIFEHWKRSMNSILNLNNIWIVAYFLNYIEHSFSGTVADWYDSLTEDGKNILRMMEIPAAMFKNLRTEIKTEFIGAKLDSKGEVREWQRKINNIKLWDMRYLENYIAEFSQYYYKIGHNKTNLGIFYDKLSCPINSIINEKYIAWFKRAYFIGTLGSRISYLRKWVNDQCFDL